MGESGTRSNPVDAAGQLASSVVRPMVKDAVIEAMEEAESEQQSGSNRRVLPGLLLLGIGFVLGALVVKRRASSESRFDEGIDEIDSSGPVSAGEAEPESTSTEESEEEAVDASSSD